jgi:aspartate/methionine/tyrosine aminotransferase
MTYLNDGDEVLVPNPGYPTYRSAVKLAGATCVDYDLLEKNNYEPDLNNISNKEGKIKLMFVNYPHMPTGQLPSASMFERLVKWAKANNVLIVHDNPYSFILNESPASLLSIEGARDVVIELNSLSKSQNMAGWRVGFLCGAKERIDEVLRFKSNMDSGMFLPVQLAAARALGLGKYWYDSVNSVYRERREKVFELLDLLKCSYSKEQVGLFVWAKIPVTFNSGYELSDEVLYKANVFITPGGIFGNAGDGYIRVSLCSPVEKLEEAKKKISEL